MPTWIVDGMNVIGSQPEKRWWADRYGAMEELARTLRKFRRDGGDEVELFLDGRSSGRVHGAAGHVAVAFAGGGPNAADRAIVERVKGDADPGSLTVVSSDKMLADRARRAGAQVSSSGAFLRLLAARDGR
ncbi:MAG: NYN domain-containing protein [Solirubrobacterales bacterium]